MTKLAPWKSWLSKHNLWSREYMPGPPPFTRLFCTQPGCRKTIDRPGLQITSPGNLNAHYHLMHPLIATSAKHAAILRQNTALASLPSSSHASVESAQYSSSCRKVAFKLTMRDIDNCLWHFSPKISLRSMS
jgi:hypothetical protein